MEHFQCLAEVTKTNTKQTEACVRLENHHINTVGSTGAQLGRFLQASGRIFKKTVRLAVPNRTVDVAGSDTGNASTSGIPVSLSACLYLAYSD